MQPTSNGNFLNNHGLSLSIEHRLRLQQILNEFDDEQLHFFLGNHFKNPSISNNISNYTHEQLLRQSSNLIDNYYSYELEQTLQDVRQKRYASNSQQQQPVSPCYYNQQSVPFSISLDQRHSSTSTPVQQMRTAQPNRDFAPFSPIDTSRPHQHSSQSSYNPKSLSRPQQTAHSILSSLVLSKSSSAALTQPYPTPSPSSQSLAQAPSPSLSSSPSSRSSLSSFAISNNSQPVGTNQILHRNLPFYRLMVPVYERYNIFQSDPHRKQFVAHEEFLLSFDICNQLTLSYDYDPVLDIHTTSKCLLLRLVRIDQPPSFHGKYEDNLPPNLLMQVNGRPICTLPVPKASTRQQHDLIRAGREINITAYCMFNPTLKNEVTIIWSYHPDNITLQQQYANARYAVHIFLVEHLTVDDLCEHIVQKPVRFFRGDLFRILAKARVNDHELGLEVSDHQLKLICPIDKRRLKTPVRATTCQHLQCFDLINYIALNEISNKWVCPVCNKPALYEDLQIDSYIESILRSIENENITEIILNNELHWSPVLTSSTNNASMNPESNLRSLSSSPDLILLDDD